ncbi:unnamed protein product [Spirodela intermedia]|uniref:FLZ-type domain-containing protein n=1 Tax=Spirodela intermedia TaxID=51605 RepID=A0A7I8ISJ6_SPIIN|nr:unnamed protein product [Spirodela intermedia]CAA6660839.1 unnamed protein product [Spirodela intermedia]
MADGSKPTKVISFFGVPALFIGLTKGRRSRSRRGAPPLPRRAALGLADLLLLLQGTESMAAKLPVSAPPLRAPTTQVNSALRVPIERSEDYTCVIYRGGENPGTTHIFGDRVVGSHAGDGGGGRRWLEWTVACPEEEPPAPLPTPEEFLKSCHLCKRDLEGRDVYIYRGEMAFCSSGCRALGMPDEEEDAVEDCYCPSS